MLKITINAHALPLNRLYPTSKDGRRFLSQEGKDYKRLVSLATQSALKEQGFSFDHATQYISSEYYFYTPKLFTAAKKVNQKKPDTSNLIKALEDAIFETIGIDDLHNLDISASIHYAESPVIIVIMEAHSLTSKTGTGVFS